MAGIPIRLLGGPDDGVETEIPVNLEILEVVEDRRGRLYEVRTNIPIDNISTRILYRRSIVDQAAYLFQP